MPQQLANFRAETVKAVFSEHGLYILRQYADGQIMWGDEPMSKPYTGRFHIADQFVSGRYDIFTIRAILSGLDKMDDATQIENALFASINEEFLEDESDGE